MKRVDRILGALIGGAIGDALGGAFEGFEPGEVRLDAAVWQLSDDTQMTLATCEAIVESAGTVDPAAIAARFAHWHRASRITGFGASTYKALTELVAGGHWALVGRKGERAAGNGAAMRIAPLAFCLDPRDRAARQAIRDVARVTHHHEEAYAGALAVAVAINAAAEGRWNGENNLLDLVIESLPDTQVRDCLIKLQASSPNHSLSDLAQRFGCSGFVAESVPLALCGASRIRSLGFAALITELIACGGDADTIASMAGQVTGALIGYDGLPAEWIVRLPERDSIERIAREFSESLKAV
jgi:ADP-ribosylglycohydrolase